MAHATACITYSVYKRSFKLMLEWNDTPEQASWAQQLLLSHLPSDPVDLGRTQLSTCQLALCKHSEHLSQPAALQCAGPLSLGIHKGLHSLFNITVLYVYFSCLYVLFISKKHPHGRTKACSLPIIHLVTDSPAVPLMPPTHWQELLWRGNQWYSLRLWAVTVLQLYPSIKQKCYTPVCRLCPDWFLLCLRDGA